MYIRIVLNGLNNAKFDIQFTNHPKNMTKIRKIRFWLTHIVRRILYMRALRKKIKKNIQSLPPDYQPAKDKEYLRKSQDFLQTNFMGYKNTRWHHYYSSLNGIKDTRYIPEDLFFGRIAPVLNNYEFYNSYADKISFDLLIEKKYLPRTLLRIINFKFYDDKFNYLEFDEAIELLKKEDDEVVMKPAVFSSGGSNVVLNSPEEIIELLQKNPIYQSNSFVVQCKIKQHLLIEALHPDSVNTCRIMTANTGKRTVELSTYFRIGRNKSKIDNAQAGGIYCGVNKDGSLHEFAWDVDKRKYFRHPNTDIPFADFKIPNFDKALNFCLNQHKKLLRLTFISWDIAIGENGEPVFIEFNIRKPAINAHQVVSGPLFGEYTDEMIEKYHYERKKEPIYY